MAVDDGDLGASSGAEEPDDPQPDESQRRQPLPPEDRLWRHPSEVSSVGLPSAPLPPPGRHLRLASWPALAAMGAVGALLAGIGFATGEFGTGGGPVARPAAARTTSSGGDNTFPVISRDPDSTPSSVAVGPSFTSLVARVSPGVLGIRAHTAGGDRKGSGLVYRSDGILLTTDRLVEGATSIIAVTPSGQEEAASVIGADRESDMAVLRVAGRDLPTVPFAPDATARPGDLTLTITRDESDVGSPVVYLGTVRAVNEQIAMPTGPPLLDMIDTDSPLPRNVAGGALLDTAGQVVGVTNAASGTGTDTHCLATPASLVKRSADELISSGRATHSWLGIEGRSTTVSGPASTTPPSSSSSSSSSPQRGVQVVNISPSSPAAAAGLQPGDTIASVDDQPVSSMLDLQGDLHLLTPGSQIRFGVWRNGQSLTMGATLAAGPP